MNKTKQRVKPRESPSYKLYKSLIAKHKEIYEQTNNKQKYEQRYWIDNDVSWRELDSYTKKVILNNLEYKVSKGEL